MPETPSRDDRVTIAGSHADTRTGEVPMHMPEIPSRDDRVTIAGSSADALIGEVPMNMPSRNDGETIICACGRRFQPVGRQRFCGAACRQKAWRRRHPAPLPALPTRVPRVETVYICTECDTLYLGEQRCPDCRRFCKRVGAGGSCPHCGEPVAVADLID